MTLSLPEWRKGLAFLMLPVLAAACLLWGADSQAGAFLVSGLILCLGAVLLLCADRPDVWPGGRIAGAILLLSFSLALGLPDWHVYNLHSEYLVLAASLAVFLAGRILAVQGGAKSAWTLFLLLGLLYSIWAIVSMQMDSGLLFGVRRAYGKTGRLVASFLSANTAATLLGMIGLAAWVSLLHGPWRPALWHSRFWRSSGFVRLLSALILPLALSALLMTGSRAGAGFFLLVALACVVLYAWRMVRLSVPVLSIAVLSMAVTAALAGSAVWKRMGSLEAAIAVRSQLFSAWWQAWLQKPVTGHGLGRFAEARQQVMTVENARLLDTQGAAHNVFLHWLVQAGWLGAFCIWLLIAIILSDIAACRAHTGLCRAVLAVSAFVILHGTLDYALEIPGIVWCWAWMLGLAHGAARSDIEQLS